MPKTTGDSMSNASAQRKLDFEDVWKDILEVARIKKDTGIQTLTRKILNKIVSVREDAIYVMSEATGNIRKLSKSDFKECWNALIKNGKLSIPPVHVWNERIIMAFLAHLPYIEYSLNPQTLYLMPTATHPLGTIKRRGSNVFIK